MNKQYLMLMIASALFFTGCREENLQTDLLPGGDVLTLSVEPLSGLTRGSYGLYEGDFAFETSDRVGILYAGSSAGDYAHTQLPVSGVSVDSQTGRKKAHLHIPSSLSASVYEWLVAYYPDSAYVKPIDNDAITFNNYSDYAVNLPAEYVVPDLDPGRVSAAAPVIGFYSGEGSFVMKHVCGMMQVLLSGLEELSVRKVCMTFDRKVTGYFEISVADNGFNPIIYADPVADVPDSNVVTFTGVSADAVRLSVPLPCGTYESLYVDLLDADDNSVASHRFSTPFTINRGWGVLKRSIGAGDGFDLTDTYEYVDYFGDYTSGYNGYDDSYDYRTLLEGEKLGYQFNFSIVRKDKDDNEVGSGAYKLYFTEERIPVGTPLSFEWSEVPLPDSLGLDWLSIPSSVLSSSSPSSSYTVPLTIAPAVFLPEYPLRRTRGTATAMHRSWHSAQPAVFRDLSTYDFVTRQDGSPCETANSYVIDAPGTYMIPCVYGNAITGGALNTDAFRQPSPGIDFVNYSESPIADPVIPYDILSMKMKTRVLWQDSKIGLPILDNSDVVYVQAPGTAANCPYIVVNFDVEKMYPGNIVIALETPDGYCVWAWHLWVTSEAFSVQTVSSGGGSARFLNMNLGWTPPISYSAAKSYERKQYVTIVCQETGRVVGSKEIRQPSADFPAVQSPSYSQPYFQWGRNIPVLPSRGDDYNKPYFMNSGIDRLIYDDIVLTDMDWSSAITYSSNWNRTVRLQYTSLYYPYAMLTANYSLTETNWAGPSGNVKSILDPSPRGFRVPSAAEMAVLSSGTGTWVSASGEMPAGMQYPGGAFFPCSGYRDIVGSGYSTEGRLFSVGSKGMYWTSGSDNTVTTQEWNYYGNVYTDSYYDKGYYFGFSAGGTDPDNLFDKCAAMAVRPVPVQ